MNTDKTKPDNNEERPQIKVEDLPIEKGDENAVKGGPAYIKIDGVDGEFRPRRP